MQELIGKVVQWAEDRNLIDGSNPERQVFKTMEEATELAVAIGRCDGDFIRIDEIKDAIGDVTVTLIIIAEQVGISFESCLAAAYEQIKDRKGRMHNGLFLKEST